MQILPVRRSLKIWFALFCFLVLYAFFIEPHFGHHVREHKLKIPGWTRELSGIRIAVLTDLHVGSPHNGIEKLKSIVQKTNAAKPDLILIAGDFVIKSVVGGTFISPTEFTGVLKELRAELGVYSVLGNHDHWHDAKEVTDALEAAGLPVLTNKVQKLKFRNKEFWLAGIDDFWAGKPDIAGTLAQIRDDLPLLLLTHNPDLFVEVPKRVTLTIAGHTHGGQVYLPLIGRPIVPSQYGQRFAVGHIEEEGRHLFVSQGTGVSILPVRFLVPPEVSIVELNGI